jgi:rhodanese-related sulfurtransferase
MSPQEISAALANQEISLVDIREAPEHAAEHIAGAVLHPLSTFDPDALLRNAQRPIVFLCLSGARSAKAYRMAERSGLPLRAHLTGGITAWKQAGLPTIAGRR